MTAGGVTAGGVTALLGDIGATNARFASLDAEGRIEAWRLFLCNEHDSVEAAIEAYLAADGGERPRTVALAWASPVTGDEVSLTNHPWSFSRAALQRRLGLERLLVINDFAANALALPHLTAAETRPVGGGEAAPGAPLAVLGPGSGLGMGGLVPLPGGFWLPLAGEGGHATVPVVDPREAAVVGVLARRYGHVSAERVLSGPGLVNLYEALSEVDGKPAEPLPPARITDPDCMRADPRCREAVDLFCALLGTVAGNLALTLGARGGVYVAGGIVPKLGDAFAESRFRARFEAKGRFAGYLASIPTSVVLHPVPAFLGLAALLRGA